MSRCLAALIFWGLISQAAFCQLKDRQQQPDEKQEEAPREEDEDLIPKEYSFNPLQASKEMQVGSYYFKKGSYRAAARRFEEASKWDPGLAEAYLKRAEALEKGKDRKGAREAYAKYLEVAPDAKDAAAIRKKLEKLK